MREISFEKAVRAVEELCLEAAFDLPKDVLAGLRRSLETEPSPLGRSLLAQILENAQIASRRRRPLCQDTGSASKGIGTSETAVKATSRNRGE